MNARKFRIARALTRFFGAQPEDTASVESSPGRSRGWMGTSTGKKFYPLAPSADDVDIRDIARGLSMTCRYAGQTKRFYSVAEHCVFVSMYVPWQYAREALVHDAAEAYIGDMIRPLKHQPEMVEFRRAEATIEKCVLEHIGIVSTTTSRAAIKEIDNRILVDEISTLSACPSYYLESPLLKTMQPLGVTLRCYNPAEAEKWFLQRYEALFS